MFWLTNAETTWQHIFFPEYLQATCIEDFAAKI